jgi:hypothetical protein
MVEGRQRENSRALGVWVVEVGIRVCENTAVSASTSSSADMVPLSEMSRLRTLIMSHDGHRGLLARMSDERVRLLR